MSFKAEYLHLVRVNGGNVYILLRRSRTGSDCVVSACEKRDVSVLNKASVKLLTLLNGLCCVNSETAVSYPDYPRVSRDLSGNRKVDWSRRWGQSTFRRRQCETWSRGSCWCPTPLCTAAATWNTVSATSGTSSASQFARSPPSHHLSRFLFPS